MPKRMLQMNYGCCSTVTARDLVNNQKVLYVGVGDGMELLQFAYCSSQKDSILRVEIVQSSLKTSPNA